MDAKKKEKRVRPEGKGQTCGGGVDVDREHHGLKLSALGVVGIRKHGRKSES